MLLTPIPAFFSFNYIQSKATNFYNLIILISLMPIALSSRCLQNFVRFLPLVINFKLLIDLRHTSRTETSSDLLIAKAIHFLGDTR